jgi:hypothetical protein
MDSLAALSCSELPNLKAESVIVLIYQCSSPKIVAWLSGLWCQAMPLATLMYTCAAASDYDDWKNVYGNAGWGVVDLLPLLKWVC